MFTLAMVTDVPGSEEYSPPTKYSRTANSGGVGPISSGLPTFTQRFTPYPRPLSGYSGSDGASYLGSPSTPQWPPATQYTQDEQYSGGSARPRSSMTPSQGYSAASHLSASKSSVLFSA